ncbi:MAG TPA: serine hydrolase domain-containing protein [Ferruginibacter sp.]|nr:serine hydrolase domain-containing protein [Ferruginibacter sp.]
MVSKMSCYGTLSIKRMRIAALSIILTVFLTSCGNNARQKDANAGDSGLINLPARTALSKAEIEKYRAGCQAWFDTSLKSSGFNGGIIVAKKGNIIFEDYLGSAPFGSTDTITANTSFHIASVSKTFTAMAVLKLQEEGKINIDDELVKYFPQFNYPGVTIRTLLNHRSGLPNYLYFFEKLKWDKKKFASNEDVLDYLVTKKPLLQNITRPNTHFAYCNTNYVLLALLIEKVTGVKYAPYLQQTIFKPLQMQHTFVFDTSMKDKVNRSYDWRGGLIPWDPFDAIYGDKNIYSTVQDLLIWDKALNTNAIFADSTLSEAYQPYSNEKPGVRNYGLGWRMNIYPDGKKMIYHNGKWHGNNAAFIRLIEDSATIIVLGNKFNRNIYHAREMAALFGNYFGGSEEEETSTGKAAAVIKTDSSIPNARQKKATSKKR